MRVALVGPFPLEPVNFGGGVETSTWNLIEGLKRFEDMEIHLVTLHTSLSQDRCIRNDGVTYHYLPSSNKWQVLTLYRADRRRIHRKLADIAPDVVHAQNSQNYGHICLKSAFPVVISVHGIVQEEAKYIDAPRDKWRAFVRSRVIQKYCVQHARHIIQPTRYPEQHFGHLTTAKWHATANAIGAKFFEVKSAPERGRLLYSGAVIPRKRLLDLVKALNQVKRALPTVSLRVAGGTPDPHYLEHIKAYIAACHLEDQVTFLGLVNQEALVEEYRKCALLVLPSGQETSPMVIAEVMAGGKPVVATRVGGVSFLVDHGHTGFVVDVGDINTLANSIVTILTDEDLQVTMSQRAREKADLTFRSEIVAAQIRHVYQEVIDTYSAQER
jgi:glycosyltransferase involved in cell wall biosynthesis